MNKPSTIIYEEFKQNLAALINNSGLPAFVVEPVLKDFLNEIRIMAQRQYQADVAEYKKVMAEENKQ